MIKCKIVEYAYMYINVLPCLFEESILFQPNIRILSQQSNTLKAALNKYKKFKNNVRSVISYVVSNKQITGSNKELYEMKTNC